MMKTIVTNGKWQAILEHIAMPPEVAHWYIYASDVQSGLWPTITRCFSGQKFRECTCERLNGVLGRVPTNHKDIETQLMRKFCCNQQVLQAIENDYNEALQTLLNRFLVSKGSLRYEELPLVSNISLSNIDFINQSCKLVPPIKEGCLNSDEHAAIDSLVK